jgi:hypothetical protein
LNTGSPGYTPGAPVNISVHPGEPAGSSALLYLFFILDRTAGPTPEAAKPTLLRAPTMIYLFSALMETNSAS